MSQVIDAARRTYRALTLYEPFAWLLFHGKTIENRSWSTSWRGPIAVHAGLRRDPSEYASAKAICDQLGIKLPPFDALPFGAVLGIVDVVGVVTQSNSPWFFGPYGWVIRNPREFERPIPAKGSMGFWKWQVPA